MNAIITVVGKDRVGIICGVTTVLSELNVNILDISQTIMNDIFTMIMSVSLKDMPGSFANLSDRLAKEGEKLGVVINIQHEDIFNSMHRI
ncbi:MAG: ACT domain-containing protein [Clostridia bacterium]|nr:ACT domain-containing protein [Oscillospiraceae bacterium]MDY5627176.1 ACT domain-containing protein [Clostridia bacterium]